MTRIRNILILVATIIATAGCNDRAGPKETGSTSSTPTSTTADQGPPTIKYWSGAQQVVRQAEPTADRFHRDSESPTAALSALDNGAGLFDEVAGDLSGLAVLGVDNEALKFIQDYSSCLREAAGLLREYSAWAQESRAFGSNASSFGTMLEAGLRGALGDPLGKAMEIKVEGDGLNRKQDNLLNRARKLEARESALENEQISLRARLAGKYHREFPPLSSPVQKTVRVFSDLEIKQVQERATEDANVLGRLLIKGTHPTGTYDSAAISACNATADRREILVTIQCSWRGVTGSRYQTVFRFVVNKTRGISDLIVVSDSAIAKVDDSHRQSTRGRLHDYWEHGR